MSAAEHQSRNASSHSEEKSLTPPPQRPSLLQPPHRPNPPAAPAAEAAAAHTEKRVQVMKTSAATPAPVAAAPPSAASAKSAFKNHPIAPPSEPMQYRAIGLVRGTYQPSEEQLNRGNILTEDGTVIDAVLLGRVTSLIKKHIDLQSSHLWVVYPRTRQATEETGDEDNHTDGNGALHLQIVGIWEPETLGLPGENPHTHSDDERESASEGAEAITGQKIESEADVGEVTAEVPSDNYFSIRGEILNYDEDNEQILVKIVQGAKRSGKPPKAFKLNIAGKIAGKTVGYFWELDVERQGEILTLTEGRSIGIVPPKKKKKRGKPFGPRKGRRPNHQDKDNKSRPTRAKEKPRVRPSAPVKSNPL